MMNENISENPAELRDPVSAPHFDDRIVVLTAQPVVPLKEIQTKQRRRRLWFLGGAFAIAIVLGAASALVAVQFKRIAGNNQATQIQQPQPQAATAEVQTPPVEVDPVPDSTVVADEEPSQPAVSSPKREEPVAQRPRVVNRDRESLRGGGQPNEEEELEQIREAVLYERWQERRARRAERRERRNRGDRDLSAVDEIFEGRRRPDRP